MDHQTVTCPSYPGRSVTADGRVWSDRRQRWIATYPSNGYLATKYDGHTLLVHQLVADAFHGPCPEGHEVEHLDRDKRNNTPDNLVYVTHRYNVQSYHLAVGHEIHSGITVLPKELCDPVSPRLARVLKMCGK